MKGRKTGWNICRGCHQEELSRNFYIVNRQEDVIQEGQDEEGLTFEDGTG
jgi:hypothetical protein